MTAIFPTASRTDASENGPNNTRPTFPTSLTFIYARDGDARRKARSHVMKEVMRHKRREQDAAVDATTWNNTRDGPVLRPRSESSNSSSIPRYIVIPPLQPSSEDHQSCTSFDSRPISENEKSHSTSQGTTQRMHDDGPLDDASSAVVVRHPSPLSSLSSFRPDPFPNLPVKVLEKDRELVDHYSYIYPDLMFGFHQLYNPVQSICLNRAFQGPMAFQATVMVIGAAHLSVLRGFRAFETDSRSNKQKTRALRLLSAGISAITEKNCIDIIFGILSLASAEDRFGSPQSSWLHLQGAARVMEKFRGPLMSREHRDMTMYYNWINLTSMGYDELGLNQVFHDCSTSINRTSSLASLRPHDNLSAIEEFISFLRNAEYLAVIHRSNDYPRTIFPQRHSAFLPFSAFHRLLTAVHKKREILYTPRIQRACRLASLIYLNAALWDFRNSYSDTDLFLERFEAKVIKQELQVKCSSEAFALTLLDGLDQPSFNREGRIWFTARMVNVAKRLSRVSWNRVNNLLLGFLMLREGMGESFLMWEEKLRTELIEAPFSARELAPALGWGGTEVILECKV